MSKRKTKYWVCKNTSSVPLNVYDSFAEAKKNVRFWRGFKNGQKYCVLRVSEVPVR